MLDKESEKSQLDANHLKQFLEDEAKNLKEDAGKISSSIDDLLQEKEISDSVSLLYSSDVS